MKKKAKKQLKKKNGIVGLKLKNGHEQEV